MTDSLLQSYFYSTHTMTVPFIYEEVVAGATALLADEAEGFAIDATTATATVSVIDVGTPANDLDNVGLDVSNVLQSGTSPKLLHFTSAPYARWTPHNMFLNSGTPATQNVTLVADFIYTYGITGTGSVAGSAGASGTATAGSPVTFIATTTTGTFTVTGSPSTMFINRGPALTAYIATAGSITIGVPQGYDRAATQYGILAEPAATNLANHSSGFTTANWSISNVTRSKDSSAAPDGYASTTGDVGVVEIIDNVTNATHTIFQSMNTTNGTAYTFSCYIKAGSGGSWCNLRLPSATFTTDRKGYYDVATGTLGTSSGSPTDYNMEEVGDGWYRCWITATATATTGGNVRIAVSQSDGVDSYAGVGDRLLIWGAQFEAQPVMTSHIPTPGGATATRAADIVSAAESSFPGSDTNNTIYLDYRPLTAAATKYGWAYWKDSNNFYSLAGVTANPTMGNTNAGSSEFAVDLGTVVAGTRTQISIAAKASDFDGSQDGAAATAQGTATLTTGYTTLYLGTFGTTGSELNGFIYRMVIVPRQVETEDGTLSTWRYNF